MQVLYTLQDSLVARSVNIGLAIDAYPNRDQAHLHWLLVHILCHAAQVANDVACFTKVELWVQQKQSRLLQCNKCVRVA